MIGFTGERIAARLAFEQIVTRAAEQHVVIGSAAQRVIAAVAQQSIAAGPPCRISAPSFDPCRTSLPVFAEELIADSATADDLVVARAAKERIGLDAAVQEIVPGVAAERIGSLLAVQLVVVGAAFECVIALGTVDRIASGAAANQVAADAAVDPVIACFAVDDVRTAEPKDRVVPRAADEDVAKVGGIEQIRIVGSFVRSDQPIVVFVAEELIDDARAGNQQIIAQSAVQNIFAGVAEQLIVAVIAVDRVDSVPSRRADPHGLRRGSYRRRIPPWMRSRSASPNNWSAPMPPSMKSSPAPPRIVSSPEPPNIWSREFFAVDVIVATLAQEFIATGEQRIARCAGMARSIVAVQRVGRVIVAAADFAVAEQSILTGATEQGVGAAVPSSRSTPASPYNRSPVVTAEDLVVTGVAVDRVGSIIAQERIGRRVVTCRVASAE